MQEIIKNIAAIAGGLATIISFIVLCVKPVRSWLINIVKKSIKDNEQDISIDEMKRLTENINSVMELHTSAHLCTLRNRITKLFYKYHDVESIPDYEKKNLIKHYELYKKLGGNSFVDEIYEQIKNKKIS